MTYIPYETQKRLIEIICQSFGSVRGLTLNTDRQNKDPAIDSKYSYLEDKKWLENSYLRIIYTGWLPSFHRITNEVHFYLDSTLKEEDLIASLHLDIDALINKQKFYCKKAENIKILFPEKIQSINHIKVDIVHVIAGILECGFKLTMKKIQDKLKDTIAHASVIYDNDDEGLAYGYYSINPPVDNQEKNTHGRDATHPVFEPYSVKGKSPHTRKIVLWGSSIELYNFEIPEIKMTASAGKPISSIIEGLPELTHRKIRSIERMTDDGKKVSTHIHIEPDLWTISDILKAGESGLIASYPWIQVSK